MTAPDVEAITVLRTHLATGIGQVSVQVPRRELLTLIRWCQYRLKRCDDALRVIGELRNALSTTHPWLVDEVSRQLEIDLDESPLEWT